MPEAATLPTKEHEAFHVVGLQSTANPEDEKSMAAVLQTLWDDFSNTDYARHIKGIEEPNNVHVTYTNYHDGSVTITLGYRSKSPNDFKDGKGLKSASVAANSYFTSAMRSGTTYHDKQTW